MKTLKVAHLIPSLKVGGAEKLLVTLAENVSDLPLELTIIILRNSKNDQGLIDGIRHCGVPVKIFSFKKLKELNKVRELFLYCKREKFDVLHTHLTMANIIGPIIGRLLNIPVVTTVHNVSRTADSNLIHGRVEAWMFQNLISRLIAVGWLTAEKYQDVAIKGGIEVIPNAVSSHPNFDPDEIKSLRANLMNDPTQPMLLAAGRLTEQKGYFDLLNAIVLLRQSFPYVQLFIAGGGHLYSDLVQETERLGLSENISFLGIRDDVLKLMTASDIFVNSSHWEGMPVSILEAMAAGKAIVATQVGDVPRIGKDKETMLLMEPKHPEKIAAAIKLLLTNQMLKESIGPRAKQEVEKNFSAKSWAEKLFNIYLEVSGK